MLVYSPFTGLWLRWVFKKERYRSCANFLSMPVFGAISPNPLTTQEI
jgi:hypothetical protein